MKLYRWMSLLLAVWAFLALRSGLPAAFSQLVSSPSQRGDPAPESSRAGDPPDSLAPFLKEFCLPCHGPQQDKGGFTLERLFVEESGTATVELWDRVLGKLDGREMPPEEARQPDSTARQAAIDSIRLHLQKLLEKERTEVPLTTRRLTNIEYENTIRDLVGFRLKLIEHLPPDPTTPYRFNNNSERMRIGPEQIERYLECARRVMASAIVDPVKPKVHQSRRSWEPHGVDQGAGADEIAIWGNRRNTPGTGMQLTSFPETGEFLVRFQASAILPAGVRELPLRLVMGYNLNVNSSTQQMEPIGTVRLRNSPDDPRVFEFRGRIENYPVQTGIVRRGKRKPDALVITPQNLYDDGTLNDDNLFLRWPRKLAMPRAVVNWIEFEAPLTNVWPPAHHTRILFESPLRESDPPAYIRAVLARFMTRAFRRPVSDDEVRRFERIYEIVRPELGSLEAAMRETLAMVLVSPQFLYHTGAQDTNAREASVWPSYELASRLSYFLWSSMPDDELWERAASGQLNDPQGIQQQVRRMLADPRSRDFVRNFTMQWLSLAKLRTVPINRDLFPRFLYYVPRGERAGTEEPYRPTIRDYMIEETVGFVSELIRRNASALSLVDSDFAYLNQPLAAHYDVPGIQGDQFRPVELRPEFQLGGLLTQGAILVANGTGSAPHPIYRAVWLREAILGDEVPAPPADVPALADSAGDSADTALTIKDLLRAHRQKASCNDCHSRLDPWGIPFEHYNAIGKYQPRIPREGTRVQAFQRETHKNHEGYRAYLESIHVVKVDATARLPGGPEVSGMRQLKQYLLRERKADIAGNLLRRLLTFGLGRELTWRDRFEVESLLQQSEQSGYRVRDMIELICQSRLFRGADRVVQNSRENSMRKEQGQ